MLLYFLYIKSQYKEIKCQIKLYLIFRFIYFLFLFFDFYLKVQTALRPPSSTCSRSRRSWGPCWLGWRTSDSRCEPRWWSAAGGREPPPPSPWSDWAPSGCASTPSWCEDVPWRGSPERGRKDRGRKSLY